MKSLVLSLMAIYLVVTAGRAQDSIPSAMNRLPNIDRIIAITLNPTDAQKLRDYFNRRLQQAGDSIQEKDEIVSQDIIHFLAAEQIPFYGFFDWKGESTGLDFYIKRAIKNNFDSTSTFESLCDLKEQPTVARAVKCYAEAVRKAGWQLCYMDIDSDSYQLFVIHPKDYALLKELVANIGFRIKDESEEW